MAVARWLGACWSLLLHALGLLERLLTLLVRPCLPRLRPARLLLACPLPLFFLPLPLLSCLPPLLLLSGALLHLVIAEQRSRFSRPVGRRGKRVR